VITRLQHTCSITIRGGCVYASGLPIMAEDLDVVTPRTSKTYGIMSFWSGEASVVWIFGVSTKGGLVM